MFSNTIDAARRRTRTAGAEAVGVEEIRPGRAERSLELEAETLADE